MMMFFEKSSWLSMYPPFDLDHQESRFLIDLLVPGIQVLAHHDSEDPDIPHLRTAVLGGSKLIVNLLSLVGTLN